jgi:glycosyltransferase involved in cell wall biosynthesis
MIRLLLIGPLPPPMGGDTRHFATLAQDIAGHEGFDLRLLNISRGGGADSRWHNLRVALRTALALVANLHRTDVVSFHSSDRGMVWFAPWIVLLCRLARRPLVMRVFGGSFGDFVAGCGALERTLVRRGVLSADVILVQTRRTINQLRPFSRGRLEWFSTYIRTPSREAPVPPPGARCRRFVFLGHLWRTKGVETLLEAAALLPAGCTIDLYGSTDEYTAADIDDRGQGRVRYRGFLSHEEVDARLWEYDCLVLPTFHTGEGYPGVIAEAFAHALPVITTRWLAIPEIVDDSCGILIEPGDTRAFVDAIGALHGDSGRWLSMKASAARRAAQFDHSVWASKFEAICEELVNE